MIKQYLKHNILITDGAMGTYYYEVSGEESSMSEWANETNKEIIKNIHKEYIDAGAKLIRTNTFSINTNSMGISKEKVKQLIKKAYTIALEAIGDKEIFIGADIGPIQRKDEESEFENIVDEYKFIVDTFTQCGANIFIFETLSDIEGLQEVCEYIKQKSKENFILTQFAVDSTGHTRIGIPTERVVSIVKNIKEIDAYGFNCGVGPTHMRKIIERTNIEEQDIVSALPNASYPDIIKDRTVYQGSPRYFAQIIKDIKNSGVKILGGCCGTTPRHIKSIALLLETKTLSKITIRDRKKENITKKKFVRNQFLEKSRNNEFVNMVEIDPPYGVCVDKIMSSSKILKDAGVDLITIADSPLGKPRIDSMTVAAKIKREIGIEAMPHICCRDKNTIALKACLLGGYVEGIRNILVITGDQVPSFNRGETKGVFNYNSVKLMKLINEMNEDTFDKQYIVGGALNLNVVNKDAEIKRMNKKIQAGATFFLTQPIYENETIDYLSKIKKDKNVKIFGGILPLVSYRNALFLNNEVPGINIPQKYIDKFDENMTRDEGEKIGIEIAVEIRDKIMPYVDGIYYMAPFNRAEMIRKIIQYR